jgi:hypothetical protein
MGVDGEIYQLPRLGEGLGFHEQLTAPRQPTKRLLSQVALLFLPH